MRTSILCILILCFALAQIGYGQILFPGETGENLQNSIRSDYSPVSVLGLDRAKDTIYSAIDFFDGRVSTIYCDHSLDLPPDVDPSQWMFTGPNGGRGAEAINLEHVYPRSKGAEDGSDANSDMHHLYPTRASVNGDRASFPFADINDNQTDKWYLFTNVMTSPPATDRDLYSEFTSGRFEPRESKKGDIARAVFYFYTIYENRALSSDPDFFASMRTTLCQWHHDDEPDDGEKLRSQRIATQQGNENPFALDCTLATRAYCMDMTLACSTIISTDDIVSVSGVKAYHDGAGFLRLQWTSLQDGPTTISLYNTMGIEILRKQHDNTYAGEYQYQLSTSNIRSGIYFLRLIQKTPFGISHWSKPILISQ